MKKPKWYDYYKKFGGYGLHTKEVYSIREYDRYLKSKPCQLCGGTGEIADPKSNYVVFIECTMCKGNKYGKKT